MGNPAFDAPTYNGGKNWVKWLTGTYNDSLLLTYDLGVPGATVNQSLVSGASVDFIGQSQVFKDNFEGKTPKASWNGQNSIFGFWFGINDINNGFEAANSSAIYEQEMVQYFAQVHSLYLAGARKFFFLQAPRKCATENSDSVNALLTHVKSLGKIPCRDKKRCSKQKHGSISNAEFQFAASTALQRVPGNPQRNSFVFDQCRLRIRCGARQPAKIWGVKRNL
jgi:hypothetical protein